MTLKPWREIAIPHADVLKGTLLQSEFAADISAVHAGKAPTEYQDAEAFFERTFITEGMRRLLTHVAEWSIVRSKPMGSWVQVRAKGFTLVYPI